MKLSKSDTALVVIDPQNDVLSEKGVSWALVGASVEENNTVENLARLFQAAKDVDFQVFVSPYYLYPFDQAWQFGGAVEHMMLDDKEFFRPDPLSLERWHLMIESLRLAFADARYHVADLSHYTAPLTELLSTDYAARQRARLDPHKATVDPKRGSPTASSGSSARIRSMIVTRTRLRPARSPPNLPGRTRALSSSWSR